MPNKNYWNTVEQILGVTQSLTGGDLSKEIEDIQERKAKASDKPMEEITFAGLVKEFFEVTEETIENYRHAKSPEERASIIKEVNEVGADIFGTIAEELSEIGSYAKKRMHELEEDNECFAEEMSEHFAMHKFSSSFAEGNRLEETWEAGTRPALGDHIRVERHGGLYYHHGIYIGNNKVIHFAPLSGGEIINWSEAKVIETSLEDFLKDGEIEVRQYTDDELMELYSPKEIVQNAKHCLGYTNYNLIFNNCEHFANSCTTGKHRSPQVEELFASAVLLLK